MNRKPGFFDYGGTLMRFADRVFSQVFLNLLFVLCCLPVVTFGASVLALNSVSLQHCREGRTKHVWRTFFQAMKKHLKRGCILTIPLVVIAASAVLDFIYLNSIEGTIGSVLKIMLASSLILLGMILSYFFPLISQGDYTIGQGLMEAYRLSFLNWRKALIPVLIFAGMIGVFLFFPYFAAGAVPVILLIGFAPPNYLWCRFINSTLPM